jgi:hypothetical protein
LTTSATGVSLKNCTNGQVLKATEVDNSWTCAADNNTAFQEYVMVDFYNATPRDITNWTYPTLPFNRQLRRGGLATGSISNLNTANNTITINEPGLYMVRVSANVVLSIAAITGEPNRELMTQFSIYSVVNQSNSTGAGGIRLDHNHWVRSFSGPEVNQITDYLYLNKGDVVSGKIFIGSHQNGKVGEILGNGLTSMMVAKLSN